MQQIHCPGTCSCSHSCGLYSKGRQRQLNNSNRTKQHLYVHLPVLIWCRLTVSDAVVEACATTLNLMGTLLSKQNTFVSDEDPPGQNDSLQFTTLLHTYMIAQQRPHSDLHCVYFFPQYGILPFQAFNHQTCTLAHCNHSHHYIYIYIQHRLILGNSPVSLCCFINTSDWSVQTGQETLPQSCEYSLGDITEPRMP